MEQEEAINYVNRMNMAVQNGNVYVQRYKVERESFKTEFKVQSLLKYTM